MFMLYVGKTILQSPVKIRERICYLRMFFLFFFFSQDYIVQKIQVFCRNNFNHAFTSVKRENEVLRISFKVFQTDPYVVRYLQNVN